MAEIWLPLNDIPAEGREFLFTDQEIWSGPWTAYGLACRAEAPVRAELRLRPQDQGCLVSGRITGLVVLECDRCGNDARAKVDHRFDEYEELGEEGGEQGWLRQGVKGLELDAGGLLWEQFLLALPVHPLCRSQCKGLCPVCGADLNEGECGCGRDEGDPRLSALRNLKIETKK